MLPRSSAIAALDGEPFDVLVIGGGITGAGVALDAATRGYSVALVERGDYAIGTSSRSSKLVHGGLRYLQNFDLGLVREALVERQINVALAPAPGQAAAADRARLRRRAAGPAGRHRAEHVRRDGRGARGAASATDWSPARHRTIGGDEVAELLPALAARRPTGGYLFYDCQTDDVAARADRARRGGALRRGRRQRRRGARAARGGRPRGRRARCARRAARSSRCAPPTSSTPPACGRTGCGPRSSTTRRRCRSSGPAAARTSSSPGATLPMVAGAIAPAGGGRTIFVLPWLGQTLIGTTDNDYEGELEHIKPAVERRRPTCSTRSTRSSRARSEPGDIAGAYAGVRPLISTGDPKKSVDISRKAELYETSSGMVTITGGKLTTWRRMAKMTVDRIVEREGRDAPVPHPPGPARHGGRARRPAARCPASRRRPTSSSPAATATPRTRCCGSPPSGPELAEPVVEGRVDLLAEVVYAARREQARTVGDVLLRRTRLGADGGAARCAPTASAAPARVAAAMGAELGWDEARRAAEAAAFRGGGRRRRASSS